MLYSNPILRNGKIIQNSSRLVVDPSYLTAIAGSVLLGLSAITKNPFFLYILFVFLPVGLVNPLYIIPIYYVSSLSSQYFMLGEGLGITRILGFAILTGVILRILFGRRRFEGYWIKFLIFVGAATLISYLAANQRFIESLYIVGMNIVILFSFANIKISDNKLQRLFNSIYIAVVIVSVCIIVNSVINPIDISGRLTLSEDLNNNTFSIIMAQLTSFLISFMLYTKRKSAKIISVLLGLANVYLILLSGSRSAFIAVVISLLLILIIMKNKKGEHMKGIVIVGVVSLVCFMVISRVIEQNPFLAFRYNINNVVQSGGTGRWGRIIAEINYVIPKHPFFGVGPISSNETIALRNYLLNPGSSHNILISMLTQIGIIGSLGYITIVFSIVKKLVTRVFSCSLCIIPLCLIITGIFNGIGEIVYHERFFWSALALGVLCLNNIEKKSDMYETKH